MLKSVVLFESEEALAVLIGLIAAQEILGEVKTSSKVESKAPVFVDD